MDALNHMDLPPGHGSKKDQANTKKERCYKQKKKKIVESYINTSPTDHSALNMVFTLVRSPGNRGTEKEAKKTTTKKRHRRTSGMNIL